MKFDIGIAGADSVGLTAMRERFRHTEDFPLINDCYWSTTCAAVSSIPSMALFKAANTFGSSPPVSISPGPSASVKGCHR